MLIGTFTERPYQDLNKEVTARVTWRPYMFSHQLAPLLKGVVTPTLVVWGKDDKIVPLSCGKLFVRALPNAHLEFLPETGDSAEMERPTRLAALIAGHMSRLRTQE